MFNLYHYQIPSTGIKNMDMLVEKSDM